MHFEVQNEAVHFAVSHIGDIIPLPAESSSKPQRRQQGRDRESHPSHPLRIEAESAALRLGLGRLGGSGRPGSGCAR